MILAIAVMVLSDPAVAEKTGWESPAPMYGIVSLMKGPLSARQQVAENPGSTGVGGRHRILDYGQVTIPDRNGIFLMLAVFSESDPADRGPAARAEGCWTLRLNGRPVAAVRGMRSDLSGRGIAAEVSGRKGETLSVVIETSSIRLSTDEVLSDPDDTPCLFLVHLAPAVEALSGDCRGLACYRLKGNDGFTVRVSGADSPLVLSPGETWLVEPFRRLADIVKPETGEGGCLVHRWIARLENPQIRLTCPGGPIREP